MRAQRWSRVAAAYQRKTVALDAAAVLLVVSPLVLRLYGPNASSIGFVVAATLGFVALIWISRGYERSALGDGPAEFQAINRAGLLAAVLLMGISYTTKAEVSRLLVFAGIPLTIAMTVLGRYMHRKFLHAARIQGDAMKRTLVVGHASDVSRVTRDLARESYHGYQVTGVCLPTLDGARPIDGVPVVGALADVPQVVADRAVDVVVVAGPSLSGEALRRLSWALDRVGAQLIVAPDLVEVDGPRLTLRPAAGLSLLEVEVATPRRRMVTKAVLDRVAGALLLAAASPLIGISALAVRLTSPGKAFYRQTRVGVDGATFTMWKIRSMYVDADKRLAELADHNE
ncbi:MAG: sugar transferase, partial [Cellulomonadaceae bacterium]|nr:sugar transferase [Cellulomonadaceae bacterium]